MTIPTEISTAYAYYESTNAANPNVLNVPAITATNAGTYSLPFAVQFGNSEMPRSLTLDFDLIYCEYETENPSLTLTPATVTIWGDTLSTFMTIEPFELKTGS